MTIQYCDRCGVELVKGEQSAAINGVPDADEEGNGTVEQHLDVCLLCYREFKTWLTPPRASEPE